MLGGKANLKSAKEVNETILKAVRGHTVRSITPDRGKEFDKHAEITEGVCE